MKMKITILEDSVIESERLKNGIRKYGQQYNLNIDVLSFGRLSHRILEEVGTKEMPVLDDTGKSLVLQKIAADLKEQLPAMGSLLSCAGLSP